MVYCGGLENRCARKRTGGSNPSLSAKTIRNIVSDLTRIGIWVVVVGAVFGFLWYQGQLKRFSVYIRLTWEELKKCSWPTWDELKGSTVVVMISIALLGLFTFAVDQLLFQIFIRFKL